MNTSGQCIKRLLKQHEISPRELLVIHDDSDIKLGSYKLSFGRGTAGHKGVASVVKHLDTNTFWRARIGIRKPGQRGKAETFILKRLSKQNMQILEEVFQKIVEELRGESERDIKNNKSVF